MNLSTSWEYIEKVAESRLEHNITVHHRYQYGEIIEVLGAAGELAARRFLSLNENLHDRFDGGIDIVFHGVSIDVKTTHLTRKFKHRCLQWPARKRIKADIVLMAAVDVRTKRAAIIGYAYPQEILSREVNYEREQPCYEVPVEELHPAWELLVPSAFQAN